MAGVKIAILGCGGMAGEHARRLKGNADAQIIALCDVSEEVVEKFIARNLPDYEPRPQIFTDRAEMYAQSQLDGVIIVTPHTLHFEHGMEAIQAGCHVLMEKPMVTESGQAKTLAQAVSDAGKIFVVGYNTPGTPAFRYLRELVRSGELGKLELVSGWLTQGWRRGTTGSWRQNPALSGGGQMYDSGAHIFNSLVWTVESPVAQVAAFVDNVGTPVDINGTVNVKFQNGTMATITVGGNCPHDGADMVLAFENGFVQIDPWGGSSIKVWKGREEITPQLSGAAGTPTDNFINAILGREDPATTPQNGINQSQLMDAIYESARTGQVVSPS